MKTKCRLIFLFAICVFSSAYPQNLKTAILGNKNIFSFGTTQVNCLDGRGWNKLRRDNLNFFYSYGRVIHQKHIIVLSHVHHESLWDFEAQPPVRVSEYLDNVNLHYGYIISKGAFQVIPHAGLSYNYYGFEGVLHGYRNPGSLWNEPLDSFLDRKSIGGVTGVDVNYYLLKHFAIGAKLSYAYYPFEKAKLERSDATGPTQEFVDNYHPLDDFLFLNLCFVIRL